MHRVTEGWNKKRKEKRKSEPAFCHVLLLEHEDEVHEYRNIAQQSSSFSMAGRVLVNSSNQLLVPHLFSILCCGTKVQSWYWMSFPWPLPRFLKISRGQGSVPSNTSQDSAVKCFNASHEVVEGRTGINLQIAYESLVPHQENKGRTLRD